MQWNETGCEKCNEKRHRGNDHQGQIQNSKWIDPACTYGSNGFALRF